MAVVPAAAWAGQEGADERQVGGEEGSASCHRIVRERAARHAHGQRPGAAGIRSPTVRLVRRENIPVRLASD
eukprot:6489266-Pyramimonas_sp.AAC.2